jgi:calcineurin-like phosphoesterase
MSAEGVLERFLTQTPSRFEVEKKDVIYSAVLVTVDEESGKASSIERIQQRAG